MQWGVAVTAVVAYGVYRVGKKHMVMGPGKKCLVASLKAIPKEVDEQIAEYEKRNHTSGSFTPEDRHEMISDFKETVRENIKQIHLNYRDLPKAYDNIEDVPLSDYNYKEAFFHSASKLAYKTLLSGVNGDVVDESSLIDDLYYNSGARCNNCMFCSAALAMRMKGYKVMASETELGNLDYQFEKWFKGSKFTYPKAKSSIELFDAIRNTGDGHYGALSVVLKESGAAHSIFYAVKNGAVQIMDGQSGKFYGGTIGQLNKNLFSKISLKDTRFIDLTDAEPTKHILRAIM